MAALDVEPHIRDLLFDHAPARGAGKIYDHFKYRAPMLAALERLADRIERLTTSPGAARRLR